MKMAQVLITPTAASSMLARNTRNRSIHNGRVESLARAMSAGGFLESPMPISIGEDGTLLDGQHRLAAIVKSGLPQRMWVASGVHAEVQDVIDIGQRRSVAQGLQMEGIVNTTRTAAACRVLSMLEGVSDFDDVASVLAAKACLARWRGGVERSVMAVKGAPRGVDVAASAVVLVLADFAHGRKFAEEAALGLVTGDCAAPVRLWREACLRAPVQPNWSVVVARLGVGARAVDMLAKGETSAFIRGGSSYLDDLLQRAISARDAAEVTP